MKYMLTRLAGTVALQLIVAGPAQAENQVGVGGGFAVPAADLADQDKADLATSYSLSAHISGPLSGLLGWRIEGGYSALGFSDALKRECDDFDVDCDSARLRHASGGLQISGASAAIVPYGVFTLGVYHLDPNIDEPSVPDSETHFGIGVGGGVDFNVGDSWGLGGDLRANRIFPGDDSVLFPEGERNDWFVTTTAHLFLRF